MKPVTIIIPVYADWPSLGKCIASLQKYIDLGLHKIILVNDCGPEADEIEAKIKKAIRGYKSMSYFRNPRNLGFVKTCNKAVYELDESDNDVLLLNSDTEVTPDFLEELTKSLYSHPKIVATSPRSNNASLATIPICRAIKKGIAPKKAYKIFNKIKSKLPETQEVPVVHGFCMLIRRSLIKKYGLFDEVFGKGYGEEVDFCMRLRKKGYKCVLSNKAFVFHLEARSFSLEEKNRILKKSEKFIDERYPEYRGLVRSYMKEAIKRESAIEASVGYYGSRYSLAIRSLARRSRSLKRMVLRG